MFFPKSLIFNEDNEFIFADEHPKDGSGSLQYDEIELMQFTELKDKDGVEIYEGDILQDVRTPEWKYEVIMGKYGWRMALNGRTQTSMLRHDDMSAMDYQYEIIGNIHEDKKLLTK